MPSSGTAASRAGVGSLPRTAFVALPSRRFGRLYRSGRRLDMGPVVVITAPGETGPPQVGIVAGRAVGDAVRRNRAKRRLREAMGRVELRPDTAYVVVATPEVAATRFDALVERLAAAVVESEESNR